MMDSNVCIGCQACSDVCPCQAISFTYNKWGEGKATVDETKCINCGLCEKICPAENIFFHEPAQSVYATISKANRASGSSGGVFFELASLFVEQGGIVYGAAFDPDLKLLHMQASNISDLPKLCKSKYLHSDMSGIYNDIAKLLKEKHKVMFVGTPCQVSAVKNLFWHKYKEQLFLVDFLCHGTGTQKVFDMCIAQEQKKRNGKIIDFTFRAKTRKAEHSFQYTLKAGKKNKIISGYAFEFPYYNSYLKYNIFNEYCYTCKYTQSRRVGDITLGDFWGISKYNKRLHDQDGVSMIAVNTDTGKKYFQQISSKCVVYEYPLHFASDHNQAFRESVNEASQKAKHALEDVLYEQSEASFVERLSEKKIRKHIIYVRTPKPLKTIWSRIRGK